MQKTRASILNVDMYLAVNSQQHLPRYNAIVIVHDLTFSLETSKWSRYSLFGRRFRAHKMYHVFIGLVYANL